VTNLEVATGVEKAAKVDLLAEVLARIRALPATP
jgi:hypothetical protein